MDFAAQDAGEDVVVVICGHAGISRNRPLLLLLCRICQPVTFSERRVLAEQFVHPGDFCPLVAQIVRNRPAEAIMGNEMGGVGGHGFIAARQFVLSLRSGLDDSQTLFDRIVDGLMVANFEMQERMVFDTAPVAAKDARAADKVDGASYVAALPLCHHQKDVLCHQLSNMGEESAGQIGAAPLAAPGVHVESEELIPNFFGQVFASQPVNCNAVGQRRLALLAQRFALA